jgi:hypothetical protein
MADDNFPQIKAANIESSDITHLIVASMSAVITT